MADVSAFSPRLLKCWGNEAIVYDKASGDTHYLKPLTLALYQICREHPGYALPELTTALSTRIGVADTPELQDLTEDTLDQLRAINLLEHA
tara:strand:+ start:68 stop:340 length:273 start_codon:yes stop_codon:yes gene_type:complete